MTQVIFSSASYSAGQTRYHSFFAAKNSDTSEDDVQTPIAIAGTVRKLYVKLENAPGASESVAVTLRQNGGDSSLTTTISNTDTSGSDNSNSVSISADDELNFKVVMSGSATGGIVYVSVEFEPDTDQRFILGGTTDATMNNTGVRLYESLIPETSLTTITDQECYAPIAGTIHRFSVRLSNTPGVGKNYTFSIYKNGVMVAASEVAIADSNDTNAIADVNESFSVGDKLCVSVIASGSPTSSEGQFTIEFEPDENNKSMMFGSTISYSSSDTYYGSVYKGWHNINTTELFYYANSTEFNITALRVDLDTAPGSAPDSYTFTVRKNGGNGNNTIELEGATTSATVTNTDSFVEGDSIGLSVVPESSPTDYDVAHWALIQDTSELGASILTPMSKLW